MNHALRNRISRGFILVAATLVFAGTANAKGYSPNNASSAAHRHQIEHRLSQLEADQQKLELALKDELAKLRAELKVAREQQLAKSTVESAH